MTISIGEATYALEILLPPKCHVFNGVARSYPPDFGEDPDWKRSLLRFPGRDTEELIEDALAQVIVRPSLSRSAAYGRVRRSSGCPALPPATSRGSRTGNG